MIFRKLISVCAVVICTSVSLPAQADTGRWLKAESDHFVIYSDTSAKTVSLYLNRLEQYRYILSRFHGLTAQDDADAPKTRVYFVDSFADLKQTSPHMGDYVGGYYKSCAEDQAAVAIYRDDSIETRQDARAQAENPSQAVLFHEYAHTFMFQNSSLAYPHWFVEGYAEYFSTTRIASDTAVVGMAFSWRLPSLTWYTGDQLSWEEVLRDNWRTAKPDHAKSAAFYAQSWLLTHYILSDPARTAQMSQYVAAYGRGEDPVKAFETTFGVPANTLGKVLGAYFANLHAMEYRIKDMPAPQVTVTPLPASADRLLLWDTSARLCPWQDERPDLLKHIRTETAKYPADEYAQMVLARAEITIGDESKALPFLQTYTLTHPDDAEGRFRLGEAQYLMTQDRHIPAGETADSLGRKARAALGKAYQLDPLNAPNLYYYARAQADVPGTIGENAVTAAIAAHDLAPSVEAYALYAARLLIDRDRLDEARTVLIPLVDDPHAPDVSARAHRIIDAIDRKASVNEVRQLMISPQTADTPPAK